MPPVDTSALSVEAAAPVTSFVAAAPNSNYTLNERVKGEPLVDLCRIGGPAQKECVEVREHVTKLFALMQAQGFLCQLPFDPTHTELECTRINKIVQRQS